MTGNRRIFPRPGLERPALLVFTLALILLAGCSKPVDGYTLVSRETARADGGRFAFDLDLDDCTCTYATTIAARLNTARLHGNGLELQMNVISPTGITAIERVTFPLQNVAGKVRSRRNDGTVRDYLWPWREQIRVSGQDAGRWRVIITLPDTTLMRAVEGIGLSYEGTTWEKAN